MILKRRVVRIVLVPVLFVVILVIIVLNVILDSLILLIWKTKPGKNVTLVAPLAPKNSWKKTPGT